MNRMEDIETLLQDINELQKINRQLGSLKQYAEYMLLLKCFCVALLFIFVATKGWIRILKSKPNGHDLLFLIYAGYIMRPRAV